MTYGDLKFRLLKAYPGLDLDLLEGWAGDVYAELLGALSWSRLEVEGILQTTAQYVAGTVSVVQGSRIVTLTGGTWTAAMNGLGFRMSPGVEYYEFTFVNAGEGSLDRPYEEATNALGTYSIFQNVYPLPANCRLLSDDAFNSKLGPMKRFGHRQLQALAPWSNVSGVPIAWASYMDNGSTPPLMQIELFPVPLISVGLPFTYTADADPLSSTSQAFQVWMQPGAMIEGVTAKIKAHRGDYDGAQVHALDAKIAVSTMLSAEAQRMAPALMMLDPYFTRHRRERGR
jgi:hypothetical protein